MPRGQRATAPLRRLIAAKLIAAPTDGAVRRKHPAPRMGMLAMNCKGPGASNKSSGLIVSEAMIGSAAIAQTHSEPAWAHSLASQNVPRALT